MRFVTGFTILTLAALSVGLTGCSTAPESTAEAKSPGVVETIKRAVTPSVIVEQGTRLKIRTSDSVSTKTSFDGETFMGTLMEPVLVAGNEVIPKGTPAQFIVVHTDEGGRVKGVASLSVRVAKLTINGRAVSVESSIVVRNAPASKKNDAVKIGVGAGIGAAIGALAGGGQGAGIGAASGGAAGTGVVLATHGKPAVIAAESVLTFRLTAPLTL
ncbi:MAG: hypothetical protein ABI811_08470 [Acidobacteriota bacterium]